MLLNIHLNPEAVQSTRYDTLISPSWAVASLLDIQENIWEKDIVWLDEWWFNEWEIGWVIRSHIDLALRTWDNPLLLFSMLLYNSEPTIRLIEELRNDYWNEIKIAVWWQLVPHAKDAHISNSNIDSVWV